MLTVGAAFFHFKSRMQSLYDEREAAAIAHIVMEHITGMGKLQRLTHKEDGLDELTVEKFEKALALAVKGVPVQHITGKAWFAGYEFSVNSHVLIPRPETEELVQWIVADNANTRSALKVLDIGTGSGCIPIILKKSLPHAEVTSCDVSEQALNIAIRNAADLNTDIRLLHLDFLNEALRNELGIYNIIVSNPPYIPISEKERLHTNVSEHEPHLALFVPDNDPLVFYRAIAQFGLTHLATNGAIYCELDADHAIETKELFTKIGYADVQLRKDIHDNTRMLRARKVF